MTAEQQNILRLAALFHDAGKSEGRWQERKSGPHALGEQLRADLERVIADKDLFPEPPTEREVKVAIEIVKEHHTRSTQSTGDVEIILDILKVADNLASSQMVSAWQIDELWKRFQPDRVPVAVTADEHPISYRTLALMDMAVESRNGRVVVTNPLQSLYLIPASTDLNSLKKEATEEVIEMLWQEAGRTKLFRALSSSSSDHPVVDKRMLWADLASGGRRACEELIQEVQQISNQIDRAVRHGREQVDRDRAWLPPMKLIYRLSNDQGSDKLLGTNIPLSEARSGKRYPSSADAARIGRELGMKNPEEFASWAINVLRQEMNEPPESEHMKLDILTWSDDEVNASKKAREAYDYYKNRLWSSPAPTQWSDRPLMRSTSNYCFSCKTRPPARKAPVSPGGYFRIDTWTSSVSKKGPVQVCELCFLARAHILEVSEPSAFHVQLTPPFNQGRHDWRQLIGDALGDSGRIPGLDRIHGQEVNSHRVVIPLVGAYTPGSALELAFKRNEQGNSIIDVLFLNGLAATISSGPSHVGGAMLSGMGIVITPKDWMRSGSLLQLLVETNPRKEPSAAEMWRAANSPYGYGTQLAIRQRNGMFKSKSAAEKVTQVLSQVMNMGEDKNVFDRAASIPLLTRDHEERFKSSESVLRRMEDVVRRAAKRPEDVGADEREIVEVIAQVGKKQLRSRILKNQREWNLSNGQMAELDEALRSIAARLWSLRGNHTSRMDFINACVMRMAYSEKEGP